MAALSAVVDLVCALQDRARCRRRFGARKSHSIQLCLLSLLLMMLLLLLGVKLSNIFIAIWFRQIAYTFHCCVVKIFYFIIVQIGISRSFLYFGKDFISFLNYHLQRSNIGSQTSSIQLFSHTFFETTTIIKNQKNKNYRSNQQLAKEQYNKTQSQLVFVHVDMLLRKSINGEKCVSYFILLSFKKYRWKYFIHSLFGWTNQLKCCLKKQQHHHHPNNHNNNKNKNN